MVTGSYSTVPGGEMNAATGNYFQIQAAFLPTRTAAQKVSLSHTAGGPHQLHNHFGLGEVAIVSPILHNRDRRREQPHHAGAGDGLPTYPHLYGGRIQYHACCARWINFPHPASTNASVSYTLEYSVNGQ